MSNTKPLSRLASLLVVVCVLASSVQAQRLTDRSLLKAMSEELDRSMSSLQDQPTEPPFYLSYEINDTYVAQVGASFGHKVAHSEGAATFYDVDLRVGDPTLDNSRLNTRLRRNINGGAIGNEHAVKRQLWQLTDEAYKEAIENLVRVRSEMQVTIDTNSEALDFASAPKERFTQLHKPIEFSREQWEKRVERVSSVFQGHDLLYTGNVSAGVRKGVRYFVNSEGSQIQTNENTYNIDIRAVTRAEDGSNLMLYENFHAHDPSDLPSDRELTLAADEMVSTLIALREAPKVEPYTGPAILSGRASGVLFHEILGHRLEGHRLKQTSDAQTFKDFVGESVLPGSFSVIFDPSERRFRETPLMGTYVFDNEGVRGQKVAVIDKGILRQFLLGRSTLSDFRESNGHGRKSMGLKAVARQSNLFVEVDDPKTPDELEAQLIEMIKERDLEFGLYFDDITGGYTVTSRALPNAFTVSPIVVYKIYQDGTKQLVRGVDLIGTPLSVFESVLAGGNDPEVFNGMCGAESGNLPVSAISPSILVGQVEVQRRAQSRVILPTLPHPEA